ncbi:MAG: VOC family protein [Acidimicrobiales bacterium]
MADERPLALSSHIFVRDADAAVAFYRDVFGAAELIRNTLPDGTVLFVELAFGPAKLLVSEETPELGALAPPTIGGSPVLLMLEYDDVDGVADRAVQGGAELEMPIAEMFWGERYGVIRDPFGHRWALCTQREQLDPDEVRSRMPSDVAQAPNSANLRS